MVYSEKKYNILIVSYASEPNTGSEYGVGWNIPLFLAKRYPEYSIFVLTRSRCRDKILKVLSEDSVPNLCYLFYDLPLWLYYKNEMKSNWGEQINYILWQLLVKNYIKNEQNKHKFDLIHHLTFNQYRTPSPGFFMNIPFVMGPLGGAETIHPSFYQDLQKSTKKKEKFRLNGKDLILFKWLCRWKKNKKYFLFSTQENVERLSGYCNDNQFKLLPAIAFDPKDFDNLPSVLKNKRTFEIIYTGKALDWKGIHIFLKAANKAFVQNNIINFRIKLIGIRFESEQILVNKWLNELKLENNIELIPFIKRSDLLKILAASNLFVYPAFRDSGSMSVLEASVVGCPTICFDAGGQDAFPNDVLIKIPVEESYNENLNQIANKLLWAFNNPLLIQKIGLNAKEYAHKNLTWENKISTINSIYKSMLDV